MKTTKILSFLAIIAICSLSSCLGDGNTSQKTTSSLGNLFNAVIDQATGEITLYNNASFQVEWDYTKNIANITAMGIQLPNTSTFPQLIINDIPLKSTTNGLEATVRDYSPLNYYGEVVFDYFTLKAGASSFSISYLITTQQSKKYQVYSLPQLLGMQGETTVTSRNEGQIFTAKGEQGPTYYISFDTATKNGFILIQNAKFKESQTGINLKLPQLPFSVNSDGTIDMRAATVQPAEISGALDNNSLNSAGTPIANATASDLFLHYDPNYGTTIRFDYTLDSGDLAQEKYHLEFNISYTANTSGIM